MKNIIWLFTFLFFLCSCGKEKQEPKDYIEIDMVPLIEGEAQKMPLQEWAKSVRFIPLETNDDILIAGIGNVFQRGDTLLVYHSERLSLFDMNGKYLCDIGSKGQGPEEYLSVKDLMLDNASKELYIMDYLGRKMKVFGFDGIFHRSLPLPDDFAYTNSLLSLEDKAI